MSITPLIIDDMSQEEISKLFKVYKTLCKMMEDRGYDGTVPLKYDDWLEERKSKASMQGIFSKKDKEDKSKVIRLFYYYIPSPKLNMESIHIFLELLKNAQANSGLIIMPGKMSSQAEQKIKEINNELQIEVFTLGDLVVNITEHELPYFRNQNYIYFYMKKEIVPKHLLLSPEDKELLLKRYKIKEHQLPKILLSDPVARYLGLKRGDVVKIIRVSETAGKYITYRIACS